MRGFFLDNVNIQGYGTVVAGFNNANAVGGSYYYHWARDGAKTMRALQVWADFGVGGLYAGLKSQSTNKGGPVSSSCQCCWLIVRGVGGRRCVCVCRGAVFYFCLFLL